MTDFDRSRFRAELILQLPDVAHFQHKAGPNAIATYGDPDYDRDALAAWILEQVDAASVTPDEELSRVVELAGAGATVKAMVEFSSYLTQLAAVLRRGHTLASQHDLARTITVEAGKLQGIAAEILTNYPALVQVGEREPGLVLPGQNG